MRGSAILFLALTLVVIGCGKKNNAPTVATPGACSKSTLLGKFTGTFDSSVASADTLTFNSDCTGTETYCGATFTFEPTTDTNGALSMKFSKVTSTANGCFSTGDASFMYSVNGNSAAFDWGNGASYSK